MSVMDIRQSICDAILEFDPQIQAKPKQIHVECFQRLLSGNDVFVNLPVGYDKSLIYQDDLDEHYYNQDIYNDTDQDKQLVFTCVSDGNVAQLRRYLDRGGNINITNTYEQTPLHLVAALKPTDANLEVLSLLISFGCPVDAQERFGETALHVASETSAQYIQILLDAGCTVNAQDNAGRTALMLACRTPSTQSLTIIQYLIDRGANVNQTDEEGQNALHYACRYKEDVSVRSEIFYKLLYAGVDVNPSDVHGHSPGFVYFATAPDLTTFNSHQVLDIRPLLCGGVKFLENGVVAQQLMRFFMNVDYQRSDHLKVLSYAIDICEPLCRVETLIKTKTHVQNLQLHTDVILNRDTTGILEKLNRKLLMVRSLKSSCRIIVRESLHDRIFLNTDKLKLPKYLEDYIKYSECM